jgi:3',5'-nucleoside bisphosphate phosphatase
MNPAAEGALRPLRADLHVHTVGSPCAELEMLPPLIVARALELGLGMIAITDHNSAENVQAVQRAAAGSSLTVIPGMEVQTLEEVHGVCLFPGLEQALAWQQVVYANLPDRPNPAEVFGAQLVVDETGEFVRFNERLLLTACALTIDAVVTGVRALGGLCIAAHVDREAFSLLANLGFVPPGLALAALEVSGHTGPKAFRALHPELADWPIIQSGDAHRLSEMRAALCLTVQEPTLAELAMALRGEKGRVAACCV